MEHSLDKIQSKPSDYKICPACNKLNWYENEVCCSCCYFIEDVNIAEKEDILNYVKAEVEFYKLEFGYDTDTALNVKIEI